MTTVAWVAAGVLVWVVAMVFTVALCNHAKGN
jgi:hypothetical protein